MDGPYANPIPAVIAPPGFAIMALSLHSRSG
jgi:hypothetical protein